MKIAAIFVLVAWWAVPAVAQRPGVADAQTPEYANARHADYHAG